MNYVQAMTLIIEATAFYANEIGITEVAYPNMTFTPPDSGFWIELTVFPNPVDPDLTGNYVAQRGIWQINVCARKEIGILDLYNKADELLAAGPVKGVSENGLVITTAPRILSAIQMDDRFILPITIEYSE